MHTNVVYSIIQFLHFVHLEASTLANEWPPFMVWWSCAKCCFLFNAATTTTILQVQGTVRRIPVSGPADVHIFEPVCNKCVSIVCLLYPYLWLAGCCDTCLRWRCARVDQPIENWSHSMSCSSTFVEFLRLFVHEDVYLVCARASISGFSLFLQSENLDSSFLSVLMLSRAPWAFFLSYTLQCNINNLVLPLVHMPCILRFNSVPFDHESMKENFSKEKFSTIFLTLTLFNCRLGEPINIWRWHFKSTTPWIFGLNQCC